MGQTPSQKLADQLAQAAAATRSKESSVTDPNQADVAALQAAIDAAVAAATAPLQAKLDATDQDAAIAAAVAEALAPVEAELAAANTREAAAVTARDTLQSEFDTYKTQVEEAQAAAEAKAAEEAAAAEVAAAKAARLELLTKPVKDGGLGWTAEAAAPRAEVYAAMAAEQWDGVFADLRTAAQAGEKGAPLGKPDLGIGGGATVLGGTTTPAAAAAAGGVSTADAELVLGNRKKVLGLHG